MNSLLYVSVRKKMSNSGCGHIDDIVTVARSRNAVLNVTGALVVTPTHFAQMLEGSEAALSELMTSITRDQRHSHINLVHFDPKPHRDLQKWSLAYRGDSTYVSELVLSAIAAPDFHIKEHAERIRALMLMFA